MTSDAIEAVRADRDALLKIGAALTPQDWRAESGFPGWSVQDVVAHLGAMFWLLVDAARLPDVSGQPTEEAADVLVESRRDWDAAAVLADYEEVSATALDVIKDLLTLDMKIRFGSGPAQATISSGTQSFIRWITQRGNWADLGVQAHGDEAALAAARKLKVF
ncbi:MAG TPA: maleylpyruvate isomerase N-terminal domain-containing protein [Streptosporangiaceae bacterium]|jgi:hypothetical protein